MPKKGGAGDEAQAAPVAPETGVPAAPPAPEIQDGGMPQGPEEQGPVMPQGDEGLDGGMDPEMQGPDMDGAPEEMETSSSDVKEIQKATGKLSNLLNNFHSDNGDEREELKKYVEGMIDSAIEKLDDMDGDQEEAPDEMPEGPEEAPEMPMESVRFTKGQLRMIDESLNGSEDDEEKRGRKLSRKERRGIRKSPFDAPKFK